MKIGRKAERKIGLQILGIGLAMYCFREDGKIQDKERLRMCRKRLRHCGRQKRRTGSMRSERSNDPAEVSLMRLKMLKRSEDETEMMKDS